MKRHWQRVLAVLLLGGVVTACSDNPPPETLPAPPPAFPGSVGSESAEPPPPAPRPPDPPPVPFDDPVASTPLLPFNDQPIDVINGPDSPLGPVFFGYDSETLDDEARQVLEANADVLRTYSSWIITIEGHCDERGTAEYNLALGDRRAVAARNYLVSLGIPAERVRTVSYGKEFPFDPGHDEAAWRQNRRAHFMLTAK